MLRYHLKMYRDDMGSFAQRGCSNWEDALWHVNSARDHDGLPHITMGQLRNKAESSATLTPYEV